LPRPTSRWLKRRSSKPRRIWTVCWCALRAAASSSRSTCVRASMWARRPSRLDGPGRHE
jgi:hypothetical protein